MLVKDGKKLFGLEARKRVRQHVAMRDQPNRLTHTGAGGSRKIALVGTTDSGSLAPFDDEAWEIFGVGGRQEWMVRADRWYEVHRLAGESENWVNTWMEQARSFGGKIAIYMHYPIEGFAENVHSYPVERILARFGSYFMTSSFSWMMAHVIDEMCPEDGQWEPGEIGIFGIDMESGAEYLNQRAGLHHFIDLARVLGIRVTRLASSGISFEPVPYPMWQDDPLLNKLDKRQIHSRNMMMNLDASIAQTKIMIAQNEAVISALDNPAVDKGRLAKETDALKDTLKSMQEDLIHWDSVESEQQWLRDYLA